MIIVHPEYCPQNHRCPTIAKCPAGAIEQEGFAAPTVDTAACLDCGVCVQSCQVFQQVT
jgi:TPP-dependent indolepyruvate ferredoxin oxidoreductase alpha subunit